MKVPYPQTKVNVKTYNLPEDLMAEKIVKEEEVIIRFYYSDIIKIKQDYTTSI